MHMVHCRAWSCRKGLPFRCNQAQIRSCTSPRGQDHFNQHAHRGASHSLHPLDQVDSSWPRLRHIRVHLWPIFVLLHSSAWEAAYHLVAIPEFHADDEAAHLITQGGNLPSESLGERTMPSLLFAPGTGVLLLLRPWRTWLGGIGRMSGG